MTNTDFENFSYLTTFMLLCHNNSLCRC